MRETKLHSIKKINARWLILTLMKIKDVTGPPPRRYLEETTGPIGAAGRNTLHRAAGVSLVSHLVLASSPVRLASRFRFVERFEVCPGIRHVGTTLVGVAELAAPFACPVLDNLVIAVPHRCGVGLAAHFFPRQLITHSYALRRRFGAAPARATTLPSGGRTRCGLLKPSTNE